MEKDHMEIIFEDIRGKFDLVLEGHDAIRQELRETRQELNEKIEMNSFLIKALNKKIDGVESKLDSKIDSVETRLNKKIDNVELKLDKKIDSLDNNLSKKIDAVAADLAAHRADTERHGAGYKVSET